MKPILVMRDLFLSWLTSHAATSALLRTSVCARGGHGACSPEVQRNRGARVKLSPPLDRRFRIIAFDWDGTAVANRADDATPVRGPIERLFRCGVLVVVITGTNMPNVDGQLSRAIRGRHKRRLYLATNRGAEVYGFDEAFEPVLLWMH